MKRSELKIWKNSKAKLEYEMSINFRKLFSFAEVNVEDFSSEPSTEVTWGHCANFTAIRCDRANVCFV